jgi:5-methylthioribose kinase
MCEITEDLFFNDPYQIHERNNYPAELENDVAALRDDAQLKIAVASLKHRFFSHAEALLHGDIHSGSIFVADGSLKAIDAEFGYFGPIGFDVGTAIGNLLLNFCGLPGHLGIRDAAAARAAPDRYSGAVEHLRGTLPGAGKRENARRRAQRAGLCLRVPEKGLA